MQRPKLDKYGFGQLDTWFIDKYLQHDNETLEEAQARVKEQNLKTKSSGGTGNVQNISRRGR